MGGSTSRHNKSTRPRQTLSPPLPPTPDDKFSDSNGSSNVTNRESSGGEDRENKKSCVDGNNSARDGPISDKATAHPQDTPLEDTTPELQRHLTSKRVIVPHLQMFQMVDLHAKNTPREMSLTADRLVTYLMSSCTNSLKTVRIFYTWITMNIRCDNTNNCHFSTCGFDLETVLRTRSASPVGINLLFYRFCRLVSIPCSLIHGVTKLGQQFVANGPDKTKPKPNHAWVLVLVQRQWRFVDCACGRGFGEEVKDATWTREFFFLPDPDGLINSHFPLGLTNDVDSEGQPETIELKRALQMLRKPITYERFCSQATISILGMTIGLELMSHPDRHVDFEKAEQFTFGSTDITDLACVLTDKSNGSDCPFSVLSTRITASEFRTVAKPPHPGEYGLSIYVKIDGWCGWPESFHRVVEYSLNARQTEQDFNPFPEHFGVWGANSRAASFGFSRRIFKFDVLLCRTGDLYLKLPVSKFSRVKAVVSSATADAQYDADAIEDSQKTRMILSTLSMQTEGVVHIRARFPEVGFYSLSLLIQNNRDSSHDTSCGTSFTNVADFLVNCRRPSRSLNPLPKSFPMSQHFCCLLVEPLSRNLVANHTYSFRIISPFLKIVKVDGEAMKIGPRRSKLMSVSSSRSADDNEDNAEDSDDSDNDRCKAWVLNYTPTNVGSSVYVYGCGNQANDDTGAKKRRHVLSALFLFNVVAEEFGTR